MPLGPGSRLGGYEILSVLGAGGMGEVYRARDTKLGREVAIKVILDVFASDPDRIARFQREAKVLASLNHPHIAALYGLEEAAGQHFLVMELVEGQTLADRLARGPLPIEETLAIAVQMTEALEAAHEKGVVHRDLKPANVKVTPDDKVKVLDFGLAKAVETQAASGTAAANSPTLSMMASQAGIILGTAAYMSPEQAKGFPADHRSDIFSFGSVLFEMLTGRQPFQGETAPEVLASVLVREPDINRLPPDLNPRLVDLVRRCLEKHPKRRWQAIGDVRVEIEAIASAPHTAPQSAALVRANGPLWRRALPAIISSALVGALAAAATWSLKPAPTARPVRFPIALPEGHRFTAGARRYLAISPDGSRIAYTANNLLYIRPLDGAQPVPLPGTESAGGALAPTFSPDNGSVIFYSPEESGLRRTLVTGGSPQTLTRMNSLAGLHWSESGLLFGQASPTARGIYKLPATGGVPEVVISFAADEFGEAPQLLADGDTILFTSGHGPPGPQRWDAAQIVAFSIRSGKRTLLVDGACDGRYVPTGHLLFTRGGTVFAQRFDPRSLRVDGPVTPVIEGVRRAPGGVSGIADYSFSANGTLVYVPGPATGNTSGWELVLSNPTGGITALNLPPGPYLTPRAAADGKRISVVSDDNRDAFVGIYDISGASALRRVTFSGKDRYAVWTPDAKRITFQSGREGDRGIFWQAADGSGSAERLTRAGAGEEHIPQAWARLPAGDVLLFDVMKGTDVSLWTLWLKDGRKEPFGSIRSETIISAVFSPDGRWVAYDAREEGRSRVFVQPFPPTSAKYVVPRPARGASHHPLWSVPDGRRLFYGAALGVTESVTVTTSPTFEFGNPQPVTRAFQESAPTSQRAYDMMPDGRFLSIGATRGAAASTTRQEFQVVLNWFEELKARVPR